MTAAWVSFTLQLDALLLPSTARRALAGHGHGIMHFIRHEQVGLHATAAHSEGIPFGFPLTFIVVWKGSGQCVAPTTG